MASRKIHIDRLKIKLPHGFSGDAKFLAAGIGREIMRGIAEASRGKAGTVRIEAISTGKMRMSGDVQNRAASKVAAEARKNFENGGRK